VAVSDKRLTVKDLSPDQAKAYRSMLDWALGPSGEVLTVGGLAGTGKTTLLGVFAANTDLLIAYVTFTGRASSILARKLRAAGASLTDKVRPPDGMKVNPARDGHAIYDASLSATSGPAFVGTIHRLLYRPVIDPTTEELSGWVKRTSLDREYDLIVVDEASMVGASMLADLKAHGIPIMAVGDHGQLPPVMDAGDLMKSPDLVLEKIHRQALGNPIVHLAHTIRQTGLFDKALADDPQKRVVFRSKVDAEVLIENAMIPAVAGVNAAVSSSPLDVGILCWTNKSRVRLNSIARRALGFSGAPKAGEVVITLRNRPPIYNGMRGVLTTDAAQAHDYPWLIGAYVEFPDEGLPAEHHEMCGPQFCREKTFAGVDELNARGINVRSMAGGGELYDFGYAMTVHKSQGSQFQHAIFYVDRPVKPDDEDWRRFAYTAVTRASERLTIIT
jgi:exodeoxyribonuclease-5